MDDNDNLRYTLFDRLKGLFHSYRLAIIIFALASLVIAAYVYKFAPGSNGSWATETEEWARFGEYVGGFFGVFAFAGVLITVEVQRQQLSQLKAQATIDELHRICRDLASSIDDALDGPLIAPDRSNFFQVTPATMRGVLQEAAKTSESDDIDQLLMPTILAAEFGPLIKNNAEIVGPELDLLAECLDDAVVRGGSGVIFKYYRTKYRPVVLRMKVMGYAPNSVSFWV